MIGFLRGQVLEWTTESKILLEVQGVGYEVSIPLRIAHLCPTGSDIMVYTYHRLGEGVSDLYGFLSSKEKDFFAVLLSVSGIGPKSALGLMEFPVDMIAKAVEEEDIALLTKAPGLGKKTASRLILELKGKLPSVVEEVSVSPLSLFQNAIDVLVSLGYVAKEVEALFVEHSELLEGKTDEDLVKWGLSKL